MPETQTIAIPKKTWVRVHSRMEVYLDAEVDSELYLTDGTLIRFPDNIRLNWLVRPVEDKEDPEYERAKTARLVH